jgi:DNA polymerase-3 subunit alpha
MQNAVETDTDAVTEQAFVHLNVHTEYSIANSTLRISELIDGVSADGMPAVAVTDICNLYSIVKFFHKAQAKGIKPLVGADLWIHNPDQPNTPFKLYLFAQDKVGYRNLCVLISLAHQQCWHGGKPCILDQWFDEHAEGLIAISGGLQGEIGHLLMGAGTEAVEFALSKYIRWFGDRFYLELQRIGAPYEEEYISRCLSLAVEHQVPVVATNAVHFLAAEGFDAHEVRVCIQEARTLTDTRRPKNFSPNQYLRSTAEMCALFEDIPEAIENSVEIARRCNFVLHTGENFLPEFPVPEGMSTGEWLRKETLTGLERRFKEVEKSSIENASQVEDKQQYYDRVDMELEVIIQMDFPGYFLIVADFIRWARANDVPVGPGRGSGAGSIVAYALRITDLDPIDHGLLFERFLNPERVSMPDFDIDFCVEGRDRVIEYVTQHYGKEKVSQIITFGTMAAKGVMRDVGRVMGMSYGYVDTLAKLIPFEVGMTLTKAMEQEDLLSERYANEEDVTELIDMALSLEGLARNVGKHAGGVVISPSALTDFSPLYCEQGSDHMVTQFDKDDLETVGLVKFDFLGLRNLTIIDWAVKAINADAASENREPVDIAEIEMADKQAFRLLKACKTTAVFQLESRGMKDLIKRLQPDRFDDLVALVALFRPGPLGSGMVDDFIDRKHGRKRLEYPHPSLKESLEPTYGVILYQEQVMEIARVMGGYSLGGADILRRAMGKKKVEEMEKQRGVFCAGAEINQIDSKIAGSVFDLVEKFSGYGFNKSHSAAYALIAYQTAWLKAHYPAYFMAATLSAEMNTTERVVTLINDSRSIGLEISAPLVNECSWNFRSVSDTRVLYGLGAIKGIGHAVIENIVECREQGGAFVDLFDFCERIDIKRVNRRAIEGLIRAGAMDGLGTHRASMMASLGVALNAAGQMSGDRDTGQNDMFGISAPAETVAEYAEVATWDKQTRLQAEKETLGLYLSGHPIDIYEAELAQLISCQLEDVDPSRRSQVVIAGLVVGMRTLNTRRGDKMAIITLDDKTARLDVTAFGELFAEQRDVIRNDNILVIKGTVSEDKYSGGIRMTAEEIYDLDHAREQMARRLIVTLQEDQLHNGLVPKMKDLLAPSEEGRCQLTFKVVSSAGVCELDAGKDCLVVPKIEKIKSLEQLVGEEAVQVSF